MSLRLYRRPGSKIWNYRGFVAGNRLRGSARTTNKGEAARIVSEIENRHHKGHLAGQQTELRFPRAVALYLKAGKSDRFLGKIEDHWKNTKVKNMTAGAIRQSAIDLYPGANGATRNRQIITPTQAVINHCAELELCAPIRVRRFKFDEKIKPPVTVEWLDTFCAHARLEMKALATFMFATGCRISEARRLEWADIDFQNHTIHIRKTKNKRARMPHMPQRLLVALANLPRDVRPFHEPESTLRRHWDADVALTQAAVPGFERLTFHSCRHGLATKLLRDKVDVVTAAGLAGMSVQVMLKTYAHAMQDTTLTERIFDTDVTAKSGATKTGK